MSTYTPAPSRRERRAFDRALGKLTQADWLRIADLALDLMEKVNAANPKARLTIGDALEVLAKMGMCLVKHERRER